MTTSPTEQPLSLQVLFLILILCTLLCPERKLGWKMRRPTEEAARKYMRSETGFACERVGERETGCRVRTRWRHTRQGSFMTTVAMSGSKKKLVDCGACVCACLLPVVWLTQFAKELHSQGSIDEEKQHEEETKISHLKGFSDVRSSSARILKSIFISEPLKKSF